MHSNLVFPLARCQEISLWSTSFIYQMKNKFWYSGWYKFAATSLEELQICLHSVALQRMDLELKNKKRKR